MAKNNILEPSNKIPNYEPIGMGVYDFMRTNCEKYADRPALNYYDKSISYSELLLNIDKTANALIEMGVKKGDVVVVSLPAIPKAVYLFYAINKIGAIFCGMDCRITESEIRDIIDHVKPKICFVSDFHLHEFANIDSTQVVCVSFFSSISYIAAFTTFFADLLFGRKHLIAKKENMMSYSKFISKATSEQKYELEKVKANDISAYFYTSGTTHGRKCVVLTNENLNSAVMQYSFSQPDFKGKGRFCSIMPLFTCYGISLGTHLPLILGMQIRLVPLFFGKNMKDLLVKEQPSYIITVPAHWDHFITDKFKNTDLSFLKGAIVGGDKLDATSEDKLNEIFKNCNSNAKVMRGYGLTEASTAVTMQPYNTPKGSVGTNMCWSEIKIFEPDTFNPLPAGEHGEICISGPNICQGYLKDKKATDALLKVHPDGKLWLHSGDIGYLDQGGFLYFCERIKRMYVRFDGTKISPYAIETLLQKCPIVSRALVVAVDDKKHFHGKCAKAYIVLKKGIDPEDAMPILKKYSHSEISHYMRPEEYVFVNQLPTTKNGKLDYFSN